jgi:hypothetical protein
MPSFVTEGEKEGEEGVEEGEGEGAKEGEAGTGRGMEEEERERGVTSRGGGVEGGVDRREELGDARIAGEMVGEEEEESTWGMSVERSRE